MPLSARRTAFNILKAVSAGAYADVALQRHLSPELNARDRSLATELAYGTIRRQRTLDTLITQFATKPAHRQPPDLRGVLQLGLYQLRYLTQIPQSAAINSAVELAKEVKLGGLAKVVNGILRQYQRQAIDRDPLRLPSDLVPQLGVSYSYPDWIIEVWLAQLGTIETQQLCDWMSRPPMMDLRVNRLKSTPEQFQMQLHEQGIKTTLLKELPQGLRLQSRPGRLTELPGFEQGIWMVQDASAQWVSHALNPQPGWQILDLCAAPGGKTLHMAELMDGKGQIWACDPTQSRVKRIRQNCDRLGVTMIDLWQGDGRQLPPKIDALDAALVDAPCSGLGTLHRHADARWRQQPNNIPDLAKLQQELLASAASRVKVGGRLVYSTCTLHPLENESVVAHFLRSHVNWAMDPLPADHPAAHFETDHRGHYKIWPHRHNMDGFFLVRFVKTSA